MTFGEGIQLSQNLLYIFQHEANYGPGVNSLHFTVGLHFQKILSLLGIITHRGSIYTANPAYTRVQYSRVINW